MAKQKHQGGLKERLREQEAIEARTKAMLSSSIRSHEAKKLEEDMKNSLENIAQKLILDYGDRRIREISTFNRSLRTKDRGKITLAVATHLFGKYKVPSYLQECWYLEQEIVSNTNLRQHWWERRQARQDIVRVSAEEIRLRRQWFITAASGGSLYKEHTKGILSKQETHTFLNCPVDADFREAIIFAIATNHTQDLGIRTRVMKSKLRDFPGITWLERNIWREVIQFFCSNEIPLQEMNDLIDYFIHCDNRARIQQTHYSLRGRNLQSLRRQMQDWHYELARVKRMGDARWEGIPIADDEFELDGMPGNKWSFTQIKTSKDLAAEGTAMHHCVYSYQEKCVSGKSSIWSVKRHQPKKSIAFERALTLEINENGEVIQIRGFANRQARPEEMHAVNHWMRKNYLTARRYAY